MRSVEGIRPSILHSLEANEISFVFTGLLLGFLSHKVALLLKVADEVSPKVSMNDQFV